MTLDDKPIFAYWRYQARAGQVLKMVRAKNWYDMAILCDSRWFSLPQRIELL